MSKVITFSRKFPSYHPKSGLPTHFVERILAGMDKKPTYPEILRLNESLPVSDSEVQNFVKDLSELKFTPKYHTIRSGKRFKKGEYFSPRVWAGKPYQSNQIIFAPDMLIHEVYDVYIEYISNNMLVQLPIAGSINNTELLSLGEVAENDGLSYDDFKSWFNKTPFMGQIIVFSNKIKY